MHNDNSESEKQINMNNNRPEAQRITIDKIALGLLSQDRREETAVLNEP